MIGPGGRTRRLTNGQPRWQLEQTKSRKGGTERSRWMRSHVMLLILMFPRPVVQFLCRINAPSITPLCLVSGESLNRSPNNTFPGFKGDGRQNCVFLLVSAQAAVNFIKKHQSQTHKNSFTLATLNIKENGVRFFSFFFQPKVLKNTQFIGCRFRGLCTLPRKNRNSLWPN